MGIKKAKTKEIKRVTVGRAGRHGGAHRDHRARLSSAAHQADPDSRRHREGGRGQTGREAEIRGAGHMRQRSGHSRAARRRLEPHVLGDAGGRPAVALADWRYGVRGSGRAGNWRARERAGVQEAGQGLRRRASVARRIHRRRLHGRARSSSIRKAAPVSRALPAHLSGARLRAQARHALRPGPDQRHHWRSH